MLIGQLHQPPRFRAQILLLEKPSRVCGLEVVVDHPYPWLKYLNADDVKDPEINFSSCPVVSPMGEKLGSIDGFIVDSTTGRAYYVVVDTGGWFRSRHFLLPIGHATLGIDGKQQMLVTDLSRDHIKRFPGFDKDEFPTLSADAIKMLNDEICVACSVELISYSPAEPLSAAWDRTDYTLPDWWHSEPSLPERMGDRAFSEQVDYPPREHARK